MKAALVHVDWPGTISGPLVGMGDAEFDRDVKAIANRCANEIWLARGPALMPGATEYHRVVFTVVVQVTAPGTLDNGKEVLQ